jgi:hypothetical protein
MAITVFYSWQSDCPKSINRTFIEDALDKSIKKVTTDISIQIAERDGPVELDKDTKGVPGIPPITDVIFQKISKAAVFVPDLTLVGKTEKGRLIPNPNVLIEYGWALCALGYSRMIPIMTTAYGDASQENLPFNMRHRRNPITYHLSNNADLDERRRVKSALVKQLVPAITLILGSHPPEAAQIALEHIAISSTEDPSTFLKKGESLGFSGGGFRPEQELVLPENEHLFLRVIPKFHTEEIGSSQKVLELMGKSQIRPFVVGSSGWSTGRNEFGAFMASHENGAVFSLTQVFKNREIWGIDSSTIDKKMGMEWASGEFGIFPCSLLENSFLQTLSTYLTFCREILELPLPLKFIVGATKVKDYRMAAPNGTYFPGLQKFGGRVVEDHIIYDGTITDFSSDPKVTLLPFFEKLWEECGLQRPDREKL